MTEIPNALTAQEWAKRWVDAARESGYGLFIDEDGVLSFYYGGTMELDPQKTIALANAALPDADPRKITWADVQEVEDAAGEFDVAYATDGASAPPNHLRTIACKLAALLPPE